jgi:hypothetical protein
MKQPQWIDRFGRRPAMGMREPLVIADEALLKELHENE